MSQSIAQLLNSCCAQSAHPSARIDTQWLLAHVLDWPVSRLYAYPTYCLSTREQQQFTALWQRRQQGEPVSYILGQQGFWTLDLAVNAHTLIPRPETELLVEAALELADAQPITVADLGTGSGAIACALASERPLWRIIATDMSAEALRVASKNVARYAAQQVCLRQGSWCDPLAGEPCTLILSNPPYIRSDDAHLQQGDVRFEPRSALVAGNDGLQDLRLLIHQATQYLLPAGYLLLEHGYDQGEAVRALFNKAHYSQAVTRRDLNGQERITYAQWSPKIG